MHGTKKRPMTLLFNIYHSHGMVFQSTLNLTYSSYVTYNLERSFVTPSEIVELQFSSCQSQNPFDLNFSVLLKRLVLRSGFTEAKLIP